MVLFLISGHQSMARPRLWAEKLASDPEGADLPESGLGVRSRAMGETDPAWLLHRVTSEQSLRVHVQTHTDSDKHTPLSFHLHICSLSC